MKKSNQSGFGAIEVLLIVIILAIIGLLGWLAYNNSSTHRDSNDNIKLGQAQSSQSYTKAKAIADISLLISADKDACNGLSVFINNQSFKTVDEQSSYGIEGDESLIDGQFKFAAVEYKCGNQETIKTSYLKRSSLGWERIANGVSGTAFPKCSDIRGQGFPKQIASVCFGPGDTAPETI